MTADDQERIALELKNLVGYGAKHAYSKAPTLRQVVAERHPDADEKVLRQSITQELREAAGMMTSAEAQAMDALLILSRSYEGWTAPHRREEAIGLLRLSMSWETFRKEPELEYMRNLARILMEKQNPDPKWIHYIHIRTDFEFDANRGLVSLQRRMTFRSLIDGLQQWRSRSDHLTEPRVTPVYGCTIGEVSRESPDSDLTTLYIHFDQLTAGAIHTVEYLMEGTRPKLLPDPWVSMFAGEQPIDFCVMAARFKRAPRTVWSFNGAITPQAIPANRLPRKVEGNRDGVYQVDFTTPRLFFGIGWDW